MSLVQTPFCGLVVLAAGFVSALGADTTAESVRYLRPMGDKYVTECRFVIATTDGGWTITSVTDRGASRMDVVTRYDAEDRPIAAGCAVPSQWLRAPPEPG